MGIYHMKERVPLSFSIFLFSLTVIFLSACGGGGGGNSDTNGDSGKDNSDGGSGDVTIGEYDLTTYLFHQNLDLVGGKISYLVKFYSKGDGAEIFPSIETVEEYEKTSEDTIVFRVSTSSEPENTFLIKDTTVQETVHTLENQTRDFQRFVEVGTKYMDADAITTIGTQNASCTLIEHLDSFDLSTATGNYNLASGVYDDVLHVQCITGFVANGTVVAHTNIHHYFAKDIGLIFNEGIMIFLGAIYIIPQR